MKKTAIIVGAVFFLFTATINAQNDTPPKQPTTTESAATQTDNKQLTASTTATVDRWNNWSADKYKMLPMPEPLTKEKIFPVIGHYIVTAKTSAAATNATDNTGATSDVTITLDETNNGVAWVEGLPQGKIKAYLRKSPSTYMLPAQKTADDKDLTQGVLIFNKDANTLDICIGCKYNSEDPASAFTMTEEPVVEQPVVKIKSKHKKGTAKAKVKPVKTWRYSGSKTETTASSAVVPMQQ